MENEQISYDLPTGIESMEPEEAAATLSKIYADVGGNAKHPYSNTAHPQSKEFRAAVTRLHEVKNPEPEPQVNEQGEVLHNQYPQDVVDAMAEGLELKENRNIEVQEKRIEQAKTEMDLLVKAGYERTTIPDDISARQVDVLIMQRMSAEEDYDNLRPLMSQNLLGLQVPQGVRGMFETFNNSTELDPTLRQEMTEVIIGWINKARKFKEGI